MTGEDTTAFPAARLLDAEEVRLVARAAGLDLTPQRAGEIAPAANALRGGAERLADQAWSTATSEASPSPSPSGRRGG